MKQFNSWKWTLSFPLTPLLLLDILLGQSGAFFTALPAFLEAVRMGLTNVSIYKKKKNIHLQDF